MSGVRVLAVIAHHGTKNRVHLDRMLEALEGMTHDVDVVVISEAAKDLPTDIEVRVGLPTSDPWSLPFGHRQIFADRRADYDLFLYSEDDTLIEQRHVDTFLTLNAHLPDDLITGFQRFEEHPDGARSYCSIHSHYHWDVGSVATIDGLTFARLTNDHGAAYLLTSDQLDRAIASGGFLVPPHAGRYDMLVSAATDVYTQCGMRKVVCLDMIEDQLVHHLPNVYLDKLGVTEPVFQAQLDALWAIADGSVKVQRILDPVVRLPTEVWNRHAFPRPNAEVATLLPTGARRVLSVGTTSGALESQLSQTGVEVVGIPVDTVLAAVADHAGVRLLPPQLPPAPDRDLGMFDAILCLDLLGYVHDVPATLVSLRQHLNLGGELLVTVPDHGRYVLRNRLQPAGGRVPLPTDLASCGMARTSGGWLRAHLHAAGFDDVRLSHRRGSRQDPVGTGGPSARLFGNTLLARARA